MSGTNPVSAAQVSTSIPNNQPNALGITAGGLGAVDSRSRRPRPLNGSTLTFQLYSYNTTTQTWTKPSRPTVDTTGKLPSGVTAASIASGGIVAGAVDPLSGNYYWASLANAPTNAVTIFGWNTSTQRIDRCRGQLHAGPRPIPEPRAERTATSRSTARAMSSS